MTQVIIILTATYSILFLSSLTIGERTYTGSLRLQKLGAHLFAAKQKQLTSNKVFAIFDKKIQEGSTLAPTLILTILILLKSVGMLLAGIVGLSLLIVPVQGVLTAALTEYSKEKGHPIKGIRKAIFPQFITQTHLTIIGNLIGLKLILDLHTGDIDQFFGSAIFLLTLLIPLISSAITAYVEVNYYRENLDSLFN